MLKVHKRSIVLPVRKGDQTRGTAASQIAVAASPVAESASAPPAPQANATPYDARDIIISARFVHRAEPEYPQRDIDWGVQGTVIILVTIGPDGSASDLRVWQSSGDADLDRAALEAARLSTFAPPEVDGQPATQTYRIIYTFYLD
jgi:periplasmic protein TonB